MISMTNLSNINIFNSTNGYSFPPSDTSCCSAFSNSTFSTDFNQYSNLRELNFIPSFQNSFECQNFSQQPFSLQNQPTNQHQPIHNSIVTPSPSTLQNSQFNSYRYIRNSSINMPLQQFPTQNISLNPASQLNPLILNRSETIPINIDETYQSSMNHEDTVSLETDCRKKQMQHFETKRKNLPVHEFVDKSHIKIVPPNTYYINSKHKMVVHQNRIFKKMSNRNELFMINEKIGLVECFECTECSHGCPAIFMLNKDGDGFFAGPHKNCDLIQNQDIVVLYLREKISIILGLNPTIEPRFLKPHLRNEDYSAYYPTTEFINNLIGRMKSNVMESSVNSLEDAEEMFNKMSDVKFEAVLLTYDILNDNKPTGKKGKNLLVFTAFQKLLMTIPNQRLVADGTFTYVPSCVCQLFTIHMILLGKSFPICSIFMEYKKRESYDSAFSYLKTKLFLNPRAISLDFEKASRLSIMFVFGIVPDGCMFHLAHAIMKRLIKLGLKKEYSINTKLYELVRMLLSLAFVDIDEVRELYNEIKNHFEFEDEKLNEKVKLLFKYMERVWLGEDKVIEKEKNTKTEYKKGRYAIEEWNHSNHLESRTTNDCELYHKNWSEMFNRHHPDFTKVKISLQNIDKENIFILLDIFKNILSKNREIIKENPFLSAATSFIQTERSKNSHEHNLQLVKKCIEIITQHMDLFNDTTSKKTKEIQEIIEIKTNYREGKYGSNRMKYLLDLGLLNIRSQIKEELTSLFSYLKFLRNAGIGENNFVYRATMMKIEEYTEMLSGETPFLVPKTYNVLEPLSKEEQEIYQVRMHIIDSFHRSISFDKQIENFETNSESKKQRCSIYLSEKQYNDLKDLLDKEKLEREALREGENSHQSRQMEEDKEIENKEIQKEKQNDETRNIEESNQMEEDEMNDKEDMYGIEKQSSPEEMENCIEEMNDEDGISEKEKETESQFEDNHMEEDYNETNDRFEEIEKELDQSVATLRKSLEMIQNEGKRVERMLSKNTKKPKQKKKKEKKEKKKSKEEMTEKKDKKRKQKTKRKRICTKCGGEFIDKCQCWEGELDTYGKQRKRGRKAQMNQSQK